MQNWLPNNNNNINLVCSSPSSSTTSLLTTTRRKFILVTLIIFILGYMLYLTFAPTSEEIKQRQIKYEEYINQRKEVVAINLRIPGEALKCRRSRTFLHETPALLRQYGTVEEGGWCELVTEPSTQLSGLTPEEVGFRSSSSSSSTWLDYRSSADGKDWPYYQCPMKHKIKCNTEKLLLNAS